LTVVDGQSPCRNAVPAHAVRAVASRDEVTLDFSGLACKVVVDFWLVAFVAFDANVVNIKQNLSPGGNPGLIEILDDFVLTVHGNRAPGEIFEVDAVALSVEA